jgi:hypothetical protein
MKVLAAVIFISLSMFKIAAASDLEEGFSVVLYTPSISNNYDIQNIKCDSQLSDCYNSCTADCSGKSRPLACVRACQNLCNSKHCD